MRDSHATTPIIELRGVSIAFGGTQVLAGLDLEIVAGTTTMIVGRSGSGKSVLLKLMIGLLHPDRGQVLAFGRDLAKVSEVELLAIRKRMGMVFQNYALFDALSVEDNVAFETHDTGRADELIRNLGLAGNERVLPGELSGGMRRRVGLARALATNPEVVLFDEPTTGLDPIMVEKVDELIARAKADYGITSVIVSHDLRSVKRLADRIAYLHDGQIIFTGSYADFIASDLPPIREFLTELHDEVPPGRAATGEPPIIELVDLHKSFGDKPVLRGVNLAIAPQRITAVIGSSGSGKSVLVKHIMGLLRPDRGKVIVFGQDIVPLHEHELEAVRRRFSYVFQHAALLDWLTVRENIAFPLAERRQVSKHEVRTRVQALLEQLDLVALADRMPSNLSLGDRKRVAIARAMATRPDVLIYDEPTTGQDPLRTHDLDRLIGQTHEHFGITTIVISHDLVATFQLAHMIAVLHDGKIVAYGTPAEVRASPHAQVRRLLHASGLDGSFGAQPAGLSNACP